MITVSYIKTATYDNRKNISNQDFIRKANISAIIITKIRSGKYLALDKLESIYLATNCTPMLTMYLNL